MNPPDTTSNGSHTAPVQEITIDDSEPGAVHEIPITMPEGGWTIAHVAEKAGSGSPDSRVIWQFDAQDEHGGTLIVLASDPAGRTGSSH